MKTVFYPLILGILIATAHAGQRAVVTIGRLPHAPKINGRLGTEWDRAAAISGLQTAGAGGVAQPATTFYLGYDDQAIYVAARCLAPGPLIAFKREYDDEIWADECIRVFIAPEDPRQAKEAKIGFGGYAGAYNAWYKHLQAEYEFDVNARGARFDARNDVRDWDGQWTSAVTVDDDGWTAELAIPFATLGLDGPSEGALWGLNLFRNHPPDLSGWVNTPFGGYRARPLGAVYLGGTCPVVRATGLPVPLLGDNQVAVDVANPSANPVVLTLKTGAAKEDVEVGAGGRGKLRATCKLAGQGRLAVPYEVTVQGAPVPLLAGELPLTVPPKLTVSLRYFAVPGRIEAAVHVEPEVAARRAKLELTTAAGEVRHVGQDFDEHRGVILDLPAPHQIGATFEARLSVLGGDGATLLERRLSGKVPARPAWLGTNAGLPLKVLPPWTPCRVEGKTLKIIGRELTYADFALPARVKAVGAEVLAAPIRPVVRTSDGEVAWTGKECRFVSQSDQQVAVESVWRSADLELHATSTVEYDGFAWTKLILTPLHSVRGVRMALDLPYRREVAKLFYEGSAQAAHALSPVPTLRPLSTNLWLGDHERGIAWIAESLDWLRTKTRLPVRIEPGKEATIWTTTLLEADELTGPFGAQFALHFTPAKPVSLRHSRIFHGAWYGMSTARSRGSLLVPAEGRIDLAKGCLEAWVKPNFDPNETYDPAVNRSTYNRMFFTVPIGGSAIIVYYNADDRSFRLLLATGPNQYRLILGSRGPLPKDAWTYLGLSWGDSIRMRVNDQVVESPLAGTVDGSLTGSKIRLDLGSFTVDRLRLSSRPRALDTVPTGDLERDVDTLWLLDPDLPFGPEVEAQNISLVPGRNGQAVASSPLSVMDRLAAEGKRIVIFHENWSRYQGYPDLVQVPKLKLLADACHRHGMLFLVYFCQLMSDAAPEWPSFKDDFMAPPKRMWYHRDDVKQDCYVSCVNGPYGDLLLDGIRHLVEEAGIDGVYMDGTTVPWDCANPTHPGCGAARADGTYLSHQPVRHVRRFMKRLRNIFASRGKPFFLDAHTGGALNIATLSFCDGYYDGEHLARYRPGFRLAPDTFATAYTGKAFGLRGEFMPNRYTYTMDQALAVALVHDTSVRGQPAAIDLALGRYEDENTRFVGYWEHSPLYRVTPDTVLGSVYVRPDQALLALGNQVEAAARCQIDLRGLLKRFTPGTRAWDAISGEAVPLADGRLKLEMPGRSWRLIELRH